MYNLYAFYVDSMINYIVWLLTWMISCGFIIVLLFTFDFDIFIKQLKQFDTIYKAFSITVLSISYSIRFNFGLNRAIPLMIVAVTEIMFVSCHDAWKVKACVRKGVLIIIVTILGPWLLKMYLDDEDHYITALNHKLSMKNVQISSGINLLVFIAKQLVSLATNPTR